MPQGITITPLTNLQAELKAMKANTHPKYTLQSFNCSCGTIIQLNSTIQSQGIEICSNCHPYYTGKQKLLDSAGRIEKFTSRYTSIVGAKRKTRKEVKDVKGKEETTAAAE